MQQIVSDWSRHIKTGEVYLLLRPDIELSTRESK